MIGVHSNSRERKMETAGLDIVQCRHCALWEHFENADGFCRRHAPSAAETMDEVAHWPLTHAEDACGEGVPAASSETRPVPCRRCVYWHHNAAGIEPVQRRDQLADWWRAAGRCLRFAPWPSSDPGARAFRRVSHADDSCFDGRKIHDQPLHHPGHDVFIRTK